MARERTNLAERFADMRADYTAAKYSRFRRRRTGLAPMGSGADYHYRSEADYLRIMEYARDMDRNDCVVGQTIDRAVANEIQDGFTLIPLTGDPAIDRDLAARWYDWANDPEQCDWDGQMSWWAMEQAVSRAVKVDGDILGLMSTAGSLQLVEGHRLRTPTYSKKNNIVHGVEYLVARTADGKPLSTRRPHRYWLTSDDVGTGQATLKLADFRAVDAQGEDGGRQVFPVKNAKRVSQSRGISALTPIFDVAGMFDDIQFATLVQRQIVSAFVIFKEYSEKYQELVSQALASGQPLPVEEAPDGTTRAIEGLGPGRILEGRPGQKFHLDSPNVPNPEFFPHMKLVLTLIGVNLGLPLVMVLMDASETNFSGWKGALDQAQRGFKNNQRRLAECWHRPIYRWLLRRWLSEDAALRRASEREDIAIYDHRWNPPAWPYSIQPVQDATADLIRTRNGLTSERRRCAERGMEWGDVSTEIVEDNGELIKKAILMAEAINKEYPGHNITWQQVACRPMAEGVQIGINAGEPADQGQDDGGSRRKEQTNAAA